jgi:tRNA(Ile)-lysidine synthase
MHNPTKPEPIAELSRCLGTVFRDRGERRLLLAVSGGADSMALLRGVHALASACDVKCVVAHLDHGLRNESERDAIWVATQAASLDLKTVVGRIDVRAVAIEDGRGIEETARRERYFFLRETAERLGIAYVATAHTADDVIETVLHHIMRGTSLDGLRGIAPRRRLSENTTLIRPLLNVRRPEIEAFLASIGQPFLTDNTNFDVSFTRNRLRHEVLPMLRTAINPQVDEALLRLAQQAAETSALVRRFARRELKRVLIESSAEVIRLNARRLKKQRRALVRAVVAMAWRRQSWPRQAMSFAHWNALATIAIDGGRRTLPGGTDARRRRGELILRRSSQ